MKHYSKYFQILGLLLIFLFASCNQTAKKKTNQKEHTDGVQQSNLKAPLSSSSKTITLPDFIKNETNTIYKLDTEKSIINWLCVTHFGGLKFKEGILSIANGNIANNNFEIIMDSISNDDIDYILMREVLLNTLKSEDFFDIKNHPLSTFNILSINTISGDSCEIIGNLTIKDITKQICFISNIQSYDSLLIVESERFEIDRTKWGITIYSENFEQTDKSFLFTDMVDIQISMLLKKQANANLK